MWSRKSKRTLNHLPKYHLVPSPALPVRPRAVESSVTPAPNAKLKSKRLMPPPSQRSLP
jgi:hypothetical protein